MTIFDIIINFVSKIVQSSVIIQDYGLLGLFFIQLLPSFLLIDSAATVSAVILGFNPISIIIFAVLGGVIGDLLWYYFAYYSYRKIKKIENGKAETLIHRYHRPIFLFTSFPGGELILIYAGVKHIKLKQIIPFIIASHVIKTTIAILVGLGILALPEVLGKIFF